ncbi:helix-turn-helix domain-containing protein [Actinocorallia longicatena]|uniref:AraC family transcriptional regulator n=1 Tax=Actinocorallia longicatena TaxID=111803 RepID=A0ABP6QQS5_9ACTN
MVHRAAAPVLRPYVSWYHGYREVGGVPGLHRGLPSPVLTLIFTFTEPLTVAEHSDGSAGRKYEALAAGLHTTPTLIAHEGTQCGVQIGVRPLGAAALFGMPAGELAGLCVDAADVLPGAVEVQERMAAAVTWEERFLAVDEGLAGALRPARDAPGIAPEVAWAWRLLARSGGKVPVAELARRTGWSERYLRTRFTEATGLTPKAAARVFRFTRARRLVEARTTDLAGIAAACGYFDQAHLAREFNAVTGLPPTRWLAEELPNIEAKPPSG